MSSVDAADKALTGVKLSSSLVSDEGSSRTDWLMDCRYLWTSLSTILLHLVGGCC